MTDRPSTTGATLAGDAGAPGYYPDPSVPGFLRYWAGHAWVPGTSRPAPGPGEPLDPPRFVARYLSPPPYSLPPGLTFAAPADPAAPLVETGPIYFDETGAQAVFTMPAHPEPGAGGPGAGAAPGAVPGAVPGPGAAAEPGPGELEVRPRHQVESLRPVGPAGPLGPAGPVAAGSAEVTPWAVAGNGLQPVAVESWATAAALRLGSEDGSGGHPGLPAGAVVAPRKGRGARVAGAGGPEAREAESVARPLELPVQAEPEPVAGGTSGPRAARPLGGTPWHGGGAGDEAGDGSVGMAASPGALFEPVPVPVPAQSQQFAGRPASEPVSEPEPVSESAAEALPQPRSADSGSGWRADPQAQRGLMETGGAPRWVSWGVDPESGQTDEADEAEVEAAAPVETGPAGGDADGGGPEAERPGREPRAAHVTSERVRPPRRAEQTRPEQTRPEQPRPEQARAERPRTGSSARRSAPATTPAAGKRRPAAPAQVSAGVGARTFAWLVDAAVTVVVGAAVAVPLAATVRAHVQAKIDQAALAASMTGRQRQVWLLDGTVLGRVGVLLGVLLVFGLLYQVLPIARTGQTFGKRMARVRVVAAGGTGAPGFGRSLVRWLVRGLGTAVLLGPVAALLDRPARRGWHDRAARTRVVRAERG
ncbi:RDD family protein [Kitasatospora sp. NA04385]|uniref:RDD family protein n=1 Tax=Kitasatospora sp. NA04385 TaxID=2742135 RepID=UPI00158FAD29|nr:RDD family protein [Kitasatospora sp. NA04385]QKW19727.1 RDD family protein [Kitasatospora sp. NA04385]